MRNRRPKSHFTRNEPVDEKVAGFRARDYNHLYKKIFLRPQGGVKALVANR